MTEAGGSVWPEVELTDSEDENENRELQRKHAPVPGRHSDITDEDMKGFPPLLGISSQDNSSDDDNEVESGMGKDLSKGNKYASLKVDQKHSFSTKLRELHFKRNEARKLNHQEVAAEDQRKKLPKNYEARRIRAEWELEERQARDAANAAGENYDRLKMLEETADEVDLRSRRKKRRQNPDEGFSDYATAQLRQYDRLTKQMKPDVEAYQDVKEKLGEEAFPGAHNLMYGGDGKVSETAVDRMVEDLNKQIAKRSKFHRRRQHYDESDIDYINERNMEFNKKAERFYGQYTAEIKHNLERGTAI